MGQRGKKQSDAIRERNQRVWKEYLTAKVLGYYKDVWERTATVTGVGIDVVRQIINGTDPDKYYPRGA